jgi:hypothetical protein
MQRKIKVQTYDVSRDAHFWSDWYDVDSLEIVGLKNWKDIKAVMICEVLTKEQAKEFLEKFK